jgi:hypothetical protein
MVSRHGDLSHSRTVARARETNANIANAHFIPSSPYRPAPAKRTSVLAYYYGKNTKAVAAPLHVGYPRRGGLLY